MTLVVIAIVLVVAMTLLDFFDTSNWAQYDEYCRLEYRNECGPRKDTRQDYQTIHL